MWQLGVRSGRRRSHGVCSAQSWTTEQLRGPSTPSAYATLANNGPPQVRKTSILYRMACWLYEDEIRSVEGREWVETADDLGAGLDLNSRTMMADTRQELEAAMLDLAARAATVRAALSGAITNDVDEADQLDVLEGCYRVLGDAMDSTWAAWERFDQGEMQERPPSEPGSG